MLFCMHAVIAINLVLIYHHTTFNISLQLLQVSESPGQKNKKKILEKCQLHFCKSTIYCRNNATSKYRSMDLMNHKYEYLGH